MNTKVLQTLQSLQGLQNVKSDTNKNPSTFQVAGELLFILYTSFCSNRKSSKNSRSDKIIYLLYCNGLIWPEQVIW